MSATERDERGRFKARAEAEVHVDNGRIVHGQNEFAIRIPFSQYIPFVLICACFLAVGLPWFIILKPILRKIFLFMGETMIKRIKKGDDINYDDW